MTDIYKKEIDKIKDESLKESLNICLYKDYLQEDEFDDVFISISRIFAAESAKYGISNPILLYNNYDSLNACARKSDNYNLIIFNRGLLLITINEVLENERLKNFNTEFEMTARFLNISIEKLIYQFTILFTFYHEFAHLLQYSNDFSMNVSEDNEPTKTDFFGHYKELDADAYSAIHLARHINEYAVKSFPENILTQGIIGITAIFCSNLLYHLIRFPSANKELYFNENTHPHTFIRILNIIAIIVQYINQDVNLIERKINITKEDLFEPIVDEVSRLQEVYSENSLDSFRTCIETQIEDITKYINKVSKNKPDQIKSAVEIYNKFV